MMSKRRAFGSTLLTSVALTAVYGPRPHCREGSVRSCTNNRLKPAGSLRPPALAPQLKRDPLGGNHSPNLV